MTKCHSVQVCELYLISGQSRLTGLAIDIIHITRYATTDTWIAYSNHHVVCDKYKVHQHYLPKSHLLNKFPIIQHNNRQTDQWQKQGQQQLLAEWRAGCPSGGQTKVASCSSSPPFGTWGSASLDSGAGWSEKHSVKCSWQNIVDCKTTK